MDEMGQPHTENKAGERCEKVHLVTAHVLHEQRCAFAEEVTGQRKQRRPEERTHHIEGKKAGRRKTGHTEDDRQNNPETIGVSGDESNERTVLLNEPQGLAELPGDKGEHLEKPWTLPTPQIKVKLIAEKRPAKGRHDNDGKSQIPLEGQEPGQDETRLPF